MRHLSNVATLDFFADKCSGCGMCAVVCPHGVFVMRDMLAHITDRDKCMECGACVKNCSTGAVSVTPGVGCATALITGFFLKSAPTCGPGASGGPKNGACC